MKKILTIFSITILMSINAISQVDPIYNQEFRVTKFKVQYPANIEQKSGITVVFNLELKYPFEDYFNNPYFLTPNIKYNDVLAYLDINNVLKVKAKKDYNGTVATFESLSFFIPYDKIDLKKGLYEIEFIIKVNNDFKDYGEVFTKKIQIAVPQLYNYQDQEFKIRKFLVKDNVKTNNLYGIQVKFDCEFKFTASQIIGVNDYEWIKYYYFFIEIEDSETGEKYYFYKNNQNFEKEELDNITKKINFFIPYHDLKIDKGKHKIKVSLSSCNETKDYVFDNIAETEFKLNQPQIYLAHFELKSLEAKYYTYDTQNAFGKLFSKQGSNTGQGYPDIYWNVYTGKLSRYQSARNKNSFFAYAGETYFTVTDSDPIEFIAKDFDVFGKHDLVEKVEVRNLKGENFHDVNSLETNSLVELSYNFQKILPAFYKYNYITAFDKKKGDVSGVEINFSFELSDIFSNDMFVIEPIIKHGDNIIHFNQVLNPQDTCYNVYNNKLKNNLQIFVPYINLNQESTIGFKTYSKTSEQVLNNIFYQEKIEIPEKLDDVKIDIINILEKKMGDYYGVNIIFEYKIPNYYVENFGLNDFEAKIDINNTTSKKNITADSQVVDINNLPIILLDATKRKEIFIPFYIIGESNKTYDFNIETDIKSISNNILLGNKKFDIKVPVPEMNKVKIKKISLKFKTNEYKDNIFVKIEHGNRTVFQSETKKFKKNISWKINHTNSIFHKQDNIYISVWSENKYGITSKLNTWTIKGAKYSNKKKLKLKGKELLKQLKIDFY